MTLDVMHAALAVIHAVVAAAWLGAMLYSLLIVQPRAAEFFGSAERYEPFAVVVAAGARWKVLGMAAALALSGAGLVAVEVARAEDPSGLWIALIVSKGILLLVAIAVFTHVSWRMWPARIFAAPSQLPEHQLRFRVVGLVLTALVGLAFALGAIADALR